METGRAAHMDGVASNGFEASSSISILEQCQVFEARFEQIRTMRAARKYKVIP